VITPPGFYIGATEAERRRRDNGVAKGAERGGDWGRGVPFPNRLGLGERPELPQRAPESGAEPLPPTHFCHI